MDESNFEIIDCPDDCGYWHIMLTEGFKDREKAKNRVKDFLNFFNNGSVNK